MTESEAIARLKLGKIEGLETLVQLYQVKALKMAYLTTRNYTLAEDVVQSAFVHAYEHIHQFNYSRAFMVNAELTAGGMAGKSENAEEIVWYDNLLNQRGSEWTLVVTEISEEGATCTWEGGYQCTVTRPASGTPKRFTSGGPWTFRFTLP